MFRIPDTAQLLNSRRTGVAVAACLAMTALVAGCGGGDRVKAFQPTQIIAFGDEASAFDDTATATSNRLVDFGTTGVPYAARYTINVVADSPVAYCKTAAPDQALIAGCAAPSVALISTDYPSSTYFFVPQSTVFGYRLYSGIPTVNEVVTGSFNDSNGSGGAVVAGTPNPVYRTGDHLYYCSTDFGDDYGNWVQRLAHGLGGGSLSIGSGGCPLDSGVSRSYAKWGAKIDDVQTQYNDHASELRDGVLVTVLAGQNDIMDAYQSVIASPGSEQEDTAKILMRNKGKQLADIITSMVNRGARVVYLTVPDMGYSPEAVAGGRADLARALTHAFNEGYQGLHESSESGGLVLSVVNNGHKVVKVDGYNLIASLGATYGSTAACETDAAKVQMPNGTTLLSAFPTINNTDTVNKALKAKALLLNCRSNNLAVVTPATSTSVEVLGYYPNFLWADGRRLSPMGHGNMGSLALSRVRDQL